MTTDRPRYKLLLLLGLLLLAFAFQGTRGLWETDEGRYTAAALEMVRTGDWVHPKLNSLHPHYTKPPMTYWLVGGSVKLFGEHEWAARLPSGLAFALTTLLVAGIGGRLFPDKPLLGGVAYATSLAPFLAANIITTDTFLTLFETLAAFCFVRSWTGKQRLWITAMWAAFGLAFLTKGPPALLPLLGFVPFAFFTNGWRGVGRLLFPPALLAFAVVGFSWYAKAIYDKPWLWHYWLKDEVVARVASGEHKRNSEWYGPLAIYGPMLLLGTMPWAVASLGGLTELPRVFRPAWWRERRDRDPALVFLLFWLVIPLVVFVISQSRMHLYVLPLMVPLALLAVRRLPANLLARPAALKVIGAWAVVLLAVRFGMAFFPTDKDARAFAASLPPLPSDLSRLVFVEVRPRRGLSFYEGVEVVFATGAMSENDDEADTTLPAVFAEREAPQVLITFAEDADGVAASAEAAGRDVERLADAGDKAVLLLPATVKGSDQDASSRPATTQ